MEHGKLNFGERGDSIFSGAIFMSNRETKRECLQRKLFGLPLAKLRFLKQLKAGMILFLFEHEERKLYGVFEATSDGALNIIPDAYRSTGQLYPAQILFKRIWMCNPLCEDEFCSAIEENYYSPNKFHFGLSYKQVINLIHLFYSRKINIKQYKGNGIPNKIIEKFENTATDEVSSTEMVTYFKCRSDEYSREGKREVRRQLALPQVSLDPPILYKTPASTTSMQVSGGSNQVNLRPLSYPQNFYSETLKPEMCSVCLSHNHNSFHHFSTEKHPSTTSEIEHEPLPLRSSSYMPNLDNMVAPNLSSLNCYSSPNNVACDPPSNDPSIIPRMVMIQEEGAFTSSHVMNDSIPQTEITQHACVSGARPNQVFEPSNYIHLSEESVQKLDSRENQNFSLEDSKYIPSSIFHSSIPSASKKNCKYFNSVGEFSDDEDELKTYQRVEADEHNAVSGTLVSDSDLSRISVFSRLSQRRTCDEPSEGLSIDELLNMLSTRRNWWSAMEKPKHPMEMGNNEQFGCTSLTACFDPCGSAGHLNEFTQPPSQPVENSEIVQHDPTALLSDPSNDVLAEESFEPPFYNFRRRNKSQKSEVQDYSNKHTDICGSKAKLMRIKRRKIVRPLNERCIIDVKAEAKVETSAQVSLESKNESKANVVSSFLDRFAATLQNVRKYEVVGESIEQIHATSMDGTLDYIPIE